jgi:hypothetical protein
MPLDPPEPDIIINGHKLTEAQALTVRVALQCFAVTMDEDRWKDVPIRNNYLSRIAEINRYMIRPSHQASAPSDLSA